MAVNKLNSLTAIAVAAGALLVANLMIGFSLVEARSSALDAQANLESCQVLADEIVLLRDRETVASDSNVSAEILNAAILELISKAGIPEQQIAEINRVPSVPIAETEYVREDVAISLSGVTIRDAVEFMLLMSESDLGAVPTGLRLVPSRANSRDSEGTERWDVELMLTHLVFAATSNQAE
jgi:hypothetical protein